MCFHLLSRNRSLLFLSGYWFSADITVLLLPLYPDGCTLTFNISHRQHIHLHFNFHSPLHYTSCPLPHNTLPWGCWRTPPASEHLWYQSSLFIHTLSLYQLKLRLSLLCQCILVSNTQLSLSSQLLFILLPVPHHFPYLHIFFSYSAFIYLHSQFLTVASAESRCDGNSHQIFCISSVEGSANCFLWLVWSNLSFFHRVIYLNFSMHTLALCVPALSTTFTDIALVYNILPQAQHSNATARPCVSF